MATDISVVSGLVCKIEYGDYSYDNAFLTGSFDEIDKRILEYYSFKKPLEFSTVALVADTGVYLLDRKVLDVLVTDVENTSIYVDRVQRDVIGYVSNASNIIGNIYTMQ